MFITPAEILSMIIMSFAVGFIFSGMFARPRSGDVLEMYTSRYRSFFDWDAIKKAIIVVAPAIIFHELGHKFVAMAFGLAATFHASYFGLALGIFLKVIGSPFLFFIPAYVSFPAIATPLQSLLIGLSGPALNGIMYLVSKLVIAKTKRMKHDTHIMWILSCKINGFLFIFNLIPIPGFDGFHVFYNLIKIIFGI